MHVPSHYSSLALPVCLPEGVAQCVPEGVALRQIYKHTRKYPNVYGTFNGLPVCLPVGVAQCVPEGVAQCVPEGVALNCNGRQI